MTYATSRARRAVLLALTALTLAGGLTATADARWKEDPESCWKPPEQPPVCPWTP